MWVINLKWVMLFGGWFLALFVFSAQNVRAENMNFSQKILPVQFAYLNDKKEIENIWSNVSATDDQYVLKFIDQKSKVEVVPDNKLLQNFQQEKTKEAFVSSAFLTVDFIQSGKKVEEVRTYT